MKDKSLNRFAPLAICITVIFVLFFVFSYFCVWTHDDFTTSFSSTGDLIHESLYFGNGRYLGNFVVNICLRNKIVDALSRSAIITSIIVLVADIAHELNVKTLSLSFFLFAGMGNFIYNEAIIWGHGFYNFAPPIVLMLVAVKVFKDYYLRKREIRITIISPVLFIIGLCQQLFSENTTCIALLISLMIFLLSFKVREKRKTPAILYLAGSAVGAAVMFALPIVMGVSHKMDSYRGKSIGADTVSDFVYLVYNNLKISLCTFEIFFAAWFLLSFSLIISLKKCSGQSRLIRLLRPVFYGVFGSFPFISLFFFLFNGHGVSEVIEGRIGIVVIVLFSLYLLCAFIAIIELIRCNCLKGNKWVYLGLLFLCAASVAELLIITVMGARCLLLTAVLFSVFIIHYLCEEELISGRLCAACGVSGLAVLTGIIIILHSIWNVNNYRFDYAREQLDEGKEIIEIIRLPHGKWLHDQDETYAYGYYFNNGEFKPTGDFVYITLDEYLTTEESKADDP
ncbi:MAG: DUF6056 family protein [Clostridia bacterium]|nr:DUF6056 family protein [Clostridia bacterium]